MEHESGGQEAFTSESFAGRDTSEKRTSSGPIRGDAGRRVLLRSPLERDDRQMPPAALVADDEIECDARSAADEGSRRCARRGPGQP